MDDSSEGTRGFRKTFSNTPSSEKIVDPFLVEIQNQPAPLERLERMAESIMNRVHEDMDVRNEREDNGGRMNHNEVVVIEDDDEVPAKASSTAQQFRSSISSPVQVEDDEDDDDREVSEIQASLTGKSDSDLRRGKDGGQPRHSTNVADDINHGKSQTRAISSIPPRKFVSGEVAFRSLMQEACYEINHDAYHGVARFTSSVRKDDDGTDNRPPRSPWEISCCPFVVTGEDEAAESDTNNHEKQSSPNPPTGEHSMAADQVLQACHNQCPTMIQWTERAMESRRKAKNRKRKRQEIKVQPPSLGQRPADLTIRCRCDANPFCLATLGGAMNDVILRDLNNQSKSQSPNDDSTTTEGDQAQEASGMNGVSNQPSNSSEEDGGDVEIVDQFKFARPNTLKQLKRIRSSTFVERGRIRSYLQRTLQDLGSDRILDEYMNIIERYHEKLIFENPVEENDESEGKPENQIELTVPPGIQNLGATCYLNTQLQCLAQNIVFLEGIMSWEPPHSHQQRDQMTSVLQLFQKLLVSMHAGPMASIDTLDFSNELELDHFEQQDPNEFSRLFFERIHDSFLQQGKARSESKNSASTTGQDLSELLPTIFQGVNRYETQCLHCNTVSFRNEEFMDINLNISKPEEKKAKGQQSLSDAFAGAADVDVQSCMNRYCHVETLTDDNQYQCTFCNEKRDATRHICFQKLPPVLNVQLSRYIFDLASLSKKKVMDKVLLQRTIMVEEKPQQKEPTGTKQYVLCAVMKHQGKSAYSGHYIAEAMDWITGEWFEFNDEKVSLLKGGPSNCFDPSNEKPKKLPPGSQDAYNLYYVEEQFLAQSIYEFMCRQKRNPLEFPTVLSNMAVERCNVFTNLAQLCLEDQIAHSKLVKRRKMIMEHMFPPDYRLMNLSSGFVWVDGDFLRRFMSCETILEDDTNDDSKGDDSDSVCITTPSSARYLCVHNPCGMEPQLVRKGKLLPKPMFESLLKIVEQEKGNLSPYFMESQYITICNLCATSYKESLSEKLHHLRKAYDLYEMLDPKSDGENCHLDTGTDLSDDSREHEAEVFLVSCKFITAFRAWVAKAIKAAGSDEAIETIANVSLESTFEGLDCADVDVNYRITCEHGNWLNSVSKRAVRDVSWTTWQKIKTFFPKSTEHKIPRRHIGSMDDMRTYLACPKCESNDLVTDTLSAILPTMAKRFSDSKQLSGEDVLQRDGQRFRLVHKDNLLALQKFCSVYRRSNKKTLADTIKTKLEEIFLSKEYDFSLLPESEIPAYKIYADVLGKFLPPLMCKTHGKPIKAALVCEDTDKRTYSSLEGDIAVLDEAGYQEFMGQLSATAILLAKLRRDDLRLDDLELDIEEIMKDANAVCTSTSVYRCHPTVNPYRGTSGQFTVSMDSANMSVLLSVTDGVCMNPTCNLKFTEWRGVKPQEEANTGPLDPSNSKPSGMNEPIAIEIDDDDDTPQILSLTIPVIEVDAGAEKDSIFESLSQFCGMPSSDVSDSLVRRSGRRRKMRVPFGIVQSEESLRFDIFQNLASLRLFLLERCQQGAPFALSHEIQLVFWLKPSQCEVVQTIEDTTPEIHPQMIDLPFSNNEKSILEICEESLSRKLTRGDIENSIHLIRSSSFDPSAKDIPEENIMDHLLNLSSTATDTKDGKRKKPAPEKGFTGTFLSSSKRKADSDVSPIIGNDTTVMKKSALKDDKVCEGGNTQKKARFAADHEIIDQPSMIDGRDPSDPIVVADHPERECDRFAGLAAAVDLPSKPLVFEVARSLLKFPKVHSEDFCVDAASWSLKMNPSVTDVSFLLDQAYAKYLDLTLDL